jgi:hypothetical protein
MYSRQTVVVPNRPPKDVQPVPSSIDLPPPSHATVKVAKSVNLENDGHENQQIQRGTDHRVPQASRGRRAWPLTRYRHLVFYVERPDHVDVWRVLHGQRDIPAWMQDPENI